ncbi:GNAT family N-acetyltransferase [Aerophototrophica crusticola]|uniref:GNAT family N-acetyltransferase n=1 Tax=Aerophototrophica crusticola TaxID=1709002 RepID=A0A858R896_9PROT|nr:GNAT family N-acetyltransferase [Rhodospirillaceae bacterium B3]
MIPQDVPLHPHNRIDTAPLTLTGRHVRLEPLRAEHAATLAEISADTDVFRWYPAPVRDRAGMEAWVALALAEQQQGKALPFVTVDVATAAIAGSTRFGAIDRANWRAEIGWTWLAPRFQRTPLNTEAKFLMLAHAFEGWGCTRVEFKTDHMNAKSRAALARIGAVEEGTFRNHMVRADGTLRHSVYFSITDREWAGVKARLLAMLDRP